MSSNEVFLGTARKWRPSRFSDVVGQEHVTDTLRNAIEKKHIASAYIFSGPRGVGKTTTARILAKALNCLNPKGAEPCNECDCCREVNDGTSMDIIEIDGASNNSVDDVRSLREGARYPPVRGKYKMYIIDEVHMLSTSAFNALLKTLEEPPPHLIFVFATTEVSRVPATILSRCQRFDFRRMQIEHIIEQLRKIAGSDKITFDDDALLLIAKKADGAMRDALSIFDQIRAATSGEVTGARVREVLNIIDQEFFFRATDIIHAQDRKAVFAYTAELIDRGIDIQEFIAGFIDHLRNILFAATTQSASLIETTQFFQQRYLAEGKKFSEQDALRLLNIAIETDQSLRFAQQPRVHLEFALLRMASMPQSIDLQQLLNELREQKKNPVTRPVDLPASNGNAASHARQNVPTAPAVAKVPAQPAPQSNSSEPKITYSAAEPSEAWRQLIATARERRIRCWSTLEHNTIFLGIQSSAIKIAFSEEFHRDQCKRYIADLNALAKEILGAGYSFAIQEELAAEHSSEPSPAATTAAAPVGNAQNGDALAELLAREFGAEEIR